MPAERHVPVVLQRCLLHGPVQIRHEREPAIAHFRVLDAQVPRAGVIVALSPVTAFVYGPIFIQEPFQDPILEFRGERGKILEPICKS